MNERDPLNCAIEILHGLPLIPPLSASEHLALIDRAIAASHEALPSIHAPQRMMLVNFMLAELTLIKGYIAVRSRSAARKAIGAVYLDEVLRLVKTGLDAIQFTAFVGIDAKTLYFAANHAGDDFFRPVGENREWDTKHLLAHYNGLVQDLAELKTAQSRERQQLYLCHRIGLRQMLSIASTLAENRYPNSQA
jgi:hypothetical protein